MKGALLALGGTFFLLSPIWHLHPHYSLLASPLKWVFWKIPTHGTCYPVYIFEQTNFFDRLIVY